MALNGSSRLQGNLHGRFRGGLGFERGPAYPTTIGLVTLIRRKMPSLPFDIPGVLRHFSRSGDQVFRVLGL